MIEFLGGSACFCVMLTLVAFAIGAACQKKWKWGVLNPIVIGAVLVILVLKLLDIPNAAYQEGCKVLSFFMTPATICLSISFYEQFQSLKKHLLAVILGVAAGTVASLGIVLGLSSLFALETDMTMSLLPKSVTTAIGVSLSQELGGIGAITTAVIVLTGIFGNVIGPALCKLLRIRDPIAQGAAFGTAAHVVGTAKAAQLSELTGAVSSLSLTVAGILTAVLLSIASQFL